ncbi:DUF7411 family protein [Thermococcus gorgonarius]|uniref:Uncharacterized protein n=1 Tax=Thermococcus gorgonarius TaxID=71997 RepID=A0A2Z2M7R9_THEGO|nr:asparagine synthase-related protein [Thermococcus gorgonarius]ASJ00392.1 hypothetical protein A3K92_02280 [Thermococcus gorgonarius]
MLVHHLYSGGKDSSLAAWILTRLGYEVELVTISFGLLDNWRYARETAETLGFRHRVVYLPGEILENAAKMAIKDGHPNNAIQFIHERALEYVASMPEVERISDGTRRDDRVPLLDLPKARSLEDRFGVAYIRPLLGLGYKTIRELTERLFVVEIRESEQLKKADYEVELRHLLREKGIDPLTIFPKSHYQSRVLGWREQL